VTRHKLFLAIRELAQLFGGLRRSLHLRLLVFSMGGYGYCWRPFGMSFGWSPFSLRRLVPGSVLRQYVYRIRAVGVGLPYHYGGWIFSPAYGWVWTPTGLVLAALVYYRPVTAGVGPHGGTLGIVPLHPGDKPGKTAQNLNQGDFFLFKNSQIAHSTLAAGHEKWVGLARRAQRK